MLDPQLLATSPETVRESLRRRHAPPRAFETVDRLVALIAQRRRLQTEGDGCRALRNDLSLKIGAAMKAGQRAEADEMKARVKAANDRAAELDGEYARISEEEQVLILDLPNLVSPETPDGGSDGDNPVIRQIGDIPAFDFTPLPHEDVAMGLGMYDPDRASKLSGARFAVTSGGVARLERALLQFFLDLAVDEHGYREWMVPYMVTRSTLTGTGQLPKFEEDLFKLNTKLANEDAYLIPTAEVPVTNLHRDEVLEDAQLPLKYCAFTPCFRSEAGSAGRDTRGLIRLHQFHKVELVWLVRPEESDAALESLTKHAETCLQRLELPYQVVARCAADVGNGGWKGYDLEVWLPAQKAYREISSCSNFTDYQARRLRTRFKRAGDKKTTFVHTLNGSGLALGRTVAAILENYQQADGSVRVPTALQPYMRGLDVLRK